MKHEEKLAGALRRAKIKTAYQSANSFGIQKKNITSKIELGKKELLDAFKRKDKNHISELLEKLITLRAEQMGINLATLSEQFGAVDDEVIKKEMKAYLRDCHRLSLLIK